MVAASSLLPLDTFDENERPKSNNSHSHNFSQYVTNSAKDNHGVTRNHIAKNGFNINISLGNIEQALDMNTVTKAYSMKWGSSSTIKHGLDTNTVTSAASVGKALDNIDSFLLLIMVALVFSSESYETGLILRYHH